jgi:hypothetical protein
LLASSTKPMRGASGIRCARGSRSLVSNSTGTRPDCWSLVAMRLSDASAKGSVDRRPSSFWGSSLSAGSRGGESFQIHRKTRGDRMRARLQEIKRYLKLHMHAPIPLQGRWLNAVLTGYFAYHAVPTNYRTLASFRHQVAVAWRRSLRWRSQKDGTNWERMMQIADAWLPQPRILHPWPDQRFAVKHPRWEPNA